ncbi:inactive receptor-like serine/threonine-protein kinase At2g40270 [Impatiens glandulifera]|uniref:inactive receptor-like serine/threonine-protein kinase At2g40270 n=1 Tax=Impatiens glandulifera TaxID=253017 RepID=UPI001FB086BC|nr:inactive receptor-like serine/threonine-protein kinase At2g40270 [Impatiens glandulifera]
MRGSRWSFDWFKLLRPDVLLFVLVWFYYGSSICCCLNTEGQALLRFRERVVRDPYSALLSWNDDVQDEDANPCSWFGVGCTDGRVITLNLKNLCLDGTLAPELGKLTYLKSINLRNNSLWGKVPEEIGKLKELEVLDLGYNNFSGSLPTNLDNNLSLSILLLDNNEFLDHFSPEIQQLKLISESQVDENDLTYSSCTGVSCTSSSGSWIPKRKLLQTNAHHNKKKPKLSPSPSPSLHSPSPSPSPSPIQSHISLSPSPSPSPLSSSPSKSFVPSPSPVLTPISQPETPLPPLSHPSLPPSPNMIPGQSSHNHSKHIYRAMIWSGVGGSFFFVASALGIFFCRRNKVVMVGPWATGLSGQLRKAFVTGVPKLQRSELVTACEDFSNIIGSLSDGTVYKGTLSSGVEIAVISTAMKSAEDWSKSLEGQFRKKIATLSRVNHKNFVNLIGFCEEEQPFTRMMVFEYAPNGTLFEHLHIREAERLDWGARLRIAMGIAYCLEHMHKLVPPIAHGNLMSSSVYLTEDYASKLSDFSFWNEVTEANMASAGSSLLETPLSDPKSNVYNFGVLLFEMITGRLPYSVHDGSIANWTYEYFSGEKPIREILDPSLKSFKEQQLENVFEVMRECVDHDPEKRPTMEDVTARMKDITAVSPEGATPKISPLWWAELEIMSTEGS